MNIQGDNINLRIAELKDTEAIFEWENDVSHWFVSDTIAPYTVEDIQHFLVNTNEIYNSGQTRLIIENSDNVAVGCVDLFDFNPKNKRLGLGILIDENHRGMGYGKEAIKLSSDFAFESLDAQTIYAEVPESNKGSQRIFMSCGFQLSGVKKDWLWDGESFQNQLFYQKLRG